MIRLTRYAHENDAIFPVAIKDVSDEDFVQYMGTNFERRFTLPHNEFWVVREVGSGYVYFFVYFLSFLEEKISR